MNGDKLASGAKSASFTSNDGTVSQDKWNDMFKDFDPLRYIKGDGTVTEKPETLEDEEARCQGD